MDDYSRTLSGNGRCEYTLSGTPGTRRSDVPLLSQVGRLRSHRAAVVLTRRRKICATRDLVRVPALQLVLWALQHVLWALQHVLCALQHVPCALQHVPCALQHVLCAMQHV
jgi:hypothetical protein